jgi:hypothetical protein
MNTPFTMEQFFGVFAQYNTTVWPVQVVIYLLALAALFLAIRKTSYSDRIISVILALFWLWMGVIYHLIFFTAINPLAYAFGGLFILQGLLFLGSGTFRRKLSFGPAADVYGWAGGFFLLYGLLIYPLLGYFLGHVYPHSPTFGLPCPTTIFTFGLLLWTNKRVPKYLLVIPVLWSFVGFGAALQWHVLEDIMLLITGLAATAMLVYRDRAGKLTPSLSRPA